MSVEVNGPEKRFRPAGATTQRQEAAAEAVGYALWDAVYRKQVAVVGFEDPITTGLRMIAALEARGFRVQLDRELYEQRRKETADMIGLLPDRKAPEKTRRVVERRSYSAVREPEQLSLLEADLEDFNVPPVWMGAISVGGETFRCSCGSYVFETRDEEAYRCTSCGGTYRRSGSSRIAQNARKDG